VDLDHVALGVADANEAIAALVGDLGATLLWGGQSVGFRPVQLRVGDARRGMTVELLEPWATDRRDFLARFLARHGDGPHHLTFKVKDFDAALDALVASGRTPFGVERSDPTWLEAFVVPAEAFGTVVQIAQSDHGDFADEFAVAVREGPHGNPVWWRPPPTQAAEAAELRRVVLRTDARADAEAFFGGVLGGRSAATADDSTELVWPGGGRVLLEDGTGRPGIDRLELTGPWTARTIGGACFVGTASAA
jgi:catechol 2,3-dioxygenase-like lactoylglutathione lyase family enzyme